MIPLILISCGQYQPSKLEEFESSYIIWQLNQHFDGAAHVTSRIMVGTNMDGVAEKSDEYSFYADQYNSSCNSEIVDYCFRLHSLMFGFSGSSGGMNPFGWAAQESLVSLLQSCPMHVQENILAYPQSYREYCTVTPKNNTTGIEISEKVLLYSFNDHIEMRSRIDYNGGSLSGSAIWNNTTFASRLWRLGLHMSLLCAYVPHPNAVPSRLKSQINSFSLEMSNVGLGALMYPGADREEILPFEVEPLIKHFNRIYPYSKLNGWWYCK